MLKIAKSLIICALKQKYKPKEINMGMEIRQGVLPGTLSVDGVPEHEHAQVEMHAELADLNFETVQITKEIKDLNRRHQEVVERKVSLVQALGGTGTNGAASSSGQNLVDAMFG